MNELKVHLTDKVRLLGEKSSVVNFRPTKAVRDLLNSAQLDFQNRSAIINAALQIGLERSGYKASKPTDKKAA